MRRGADIIVGSVVVLAFAACGASPDPPVTQTPLVVVENASQYVLEELRFHPLVEYGDATNALAEPMPVGASNQRYMAGSTFVTVFREKFQGGELLALTTQQPITLEYAKGYRIKVFDTAFRVLDEPYVPPAMTSSTSTTTGL